MKQLTLQGPPLFTAAPLSEVLAALVSQHCSSWFVGLAGPFRRFLEHTALP